MKKVAVKAIANRLTSPLSAATPAERIASRKT
jgi:hypothetical protein